MANLLLAQASALTRRRPHSHRLRPPAHEKAPSTDLSSPWFIILNVAGRSGRVLAEDRAS